MGVKTDTHQAKAVGKNLRVSWKQCTEVGRYIDSDPVEKAKQKLQKVIEKKQPVPYTKFDSDAGHKSGKGPGKFPVKAAKKILELVKEAEANAEHQGLNPGSLEVDNVITNQGPKLQTPKRHRGRAKKSAHINIIVGER